MTMRACIYSRFSTDLQSASSIEDQARLCKARAEQLGLTIVAAHADQAVSGASLIEDRPGGRSVLEDALQRRWDVLVLESLDRLSRDSVDLQSVVRRLEHRGVRIIGISDGYDTNSGKSRKLLLGLRGIIAETYLDDLREKTHRGLTGQVSRGFSAGGLSYGYGSVSAGLDARGESIGSRFEIVPEHADIVREIFSRYGAGDSCQRIAADLNVRRITGPRGGTWCVSALYGSPAKGAGILNNELYVGRYIWNRSHWVKDPDTGKRQRFDRPRAEWHVDSRPELRIVTDEQWSAVRSRMTTPRNNGGRKGSGRPASTLFSGMLRCGICGGAVVAINARDYGCAAAKDRGKAVCTGIRVRRHEVDTALIDHLQQEVLTPAAIERIAALAIRKAQDAGKDQARADGQRLQRAGAVDAEIERITDAIAKIGHSNALADRLRRAEVERETLGEAPRPAAAAPYPLHPKVQARALVSRLAAVLKGTPAESRAALRMAFGEVRLMPEAGIMLAGIEDAAGRVAQAVGGAKIIVVAGARTLNWIPVGVAR